MKTRKDLVPISGRTLRTVLQATLCLMAAICLVAASSTTISDESEQLRSDLQKESFSSLSWSLSEFRFEFTKHFVQLLLRVQEARNKAAAGAKPALDNNQLAEVIEDAVLEAQRAIPVGEMQESLLSFYRVAGLTNKFLNLYAELQDKNGHRISIAIERSFLEAARASQSETQKTALKAVELDRRPLFEEED